MGSALPPIDPEDLRQRLADLSPIDLPDAAFRALRVHYLDLRRWNRRLSLIGPGTADEVLPRHYGESLAALPLIHPADLEILDLGSGGGFPGYVLAAATAHRDPAPRITLIEARQRKWAFLRTVIRRSGLSCRCLNARVEHPLPEGQGRRIGLEKVTLITCRAVALSPETLAALHESADRPRFLLWCGADPPTLPAQLEIRQRIDLPGSRHRRILEIVRRT